MRRYLVGRRHASRTKEFYDEQNILRRYFYVIDTKGQVFQEATKHRNFVTSLKDIPFLNMLHGLLRVNSTGIFPEYPLYFPCGKELNFILPEDPHSVAGFSKLITNTSDQSRSLFFGGSGVSQTFDPSLLFCCDESGRFYHLITQHKHLRGRLGLLHPQISENLSSNIKLSDSGDSFVFCEAGNSFPIRNIAGTT